MLETELINADPEIPETIMPEPSDPPETIMTIMTEPIPESPMGEEKPTPKKPGRPVGAKSKVQGKPRAKRKVTIDTEPVVAESVATDTIRIEDETLPRVLPNSQPIPRFSHNERSALMLQLLTQQAEQRKTNKVELWRSWFR